MLILLVVSTCSLLLFSESRPHDSYEDDSHTCAFWLSLSVVSGMKLEMSFMLALHFSIDIWKGKPCPQVFCVPAIYMVPWRLRMLMCIALPIRHIAICKLGGRVWGLLKGIATLVYIALEITTRICGRLGEAGCHSGGWGLILELLRLCSDWERLSGWWGELGFVGFVLLMTPVEECLTRILGFISLPV